MLIIRGANNIKQSQKDVVVTIGNFDGVHLAHQQLLAKLKQKGRALKRATMVIIFEPQPNEFFSSGDETRLMKFREKIAAFAEQGIDYVLCLRFNQTLAMQTPEQFAVDLLVKKLAISYIIVGDDFHFGKQRQGNFDTLEELSAKYHFQAESMATYRFQSERVSSTRIRQALQQGDIDLAQQLLGHPFAMQGKVAQGDQRGRALGFPTANIRLQRRRAPVAGVFMVKVSGIGQYPLPGVANIGTRPTISGVTRTLLEVHLLNFDQDIYGKHVEVKFLQKLRDERKFATLEELQAQIAKDVSAAQRYFDAGSI